MKAKTIVIKKIITNELTFFVVLFFTAFLAPFFGSQAVSGPLVNATLFLATIFLGLKSAIFIAVFPSIIAISVGILPLPLVPFIPFIMIGNIILIFVFNSLLKDYWLGVFTASFLKFMFLFISSQVVANFLFQGPLAKQILTMMSWPQFATAMAGGVIAYVVLQFLRSCDILKK
jgi:riboflavin transporter